MIKKLLKSKAFLMVIIVCGILILLDMFTALYIKSGIISSLIYIFGLFGAFSRLILFILSTQKSDGFKLFLMALVLFLFPFILVLCWLRQESWRTQTLIYQNTTFPNQTIEYQVKDIGTFDERTVQVTYFTPIFMLIKPVDENNINPQEWIKVNKNVDEMGIGEY